MYLVLASAGVSYLASQKAAEEGGDWRINDQKEAGFFNDYRSVGATAAAVAAGTMRGPMSALAMAAALGLGFSYLNGMATENAQATPKAGPPIGNQPPVGKRIVGYTPQGQPIYGADGGGYGMDQYGQEVAAYAFDEAMAYGASPAEAMAYAGQVAAQFGCAPRPAIRHPPAPWQGRMPPPWAANAVSGAPLMPPPF